MRHICPTYNIHATWLLVNDFELIFQTGFTMLLQKINILKTSLSNSILKHMLTSDL